MAKPPTGEELAKLTGIALPLNSIDDAMRWLEELARRTSKGEMLVDPAEQCRRAIDGWVKAWQAKEKADPLSVAKKAFTAEMAARAARKLTPEEAKRALMSRGIGAVIEILNPDALEIPVITDVPMLEITRGEADDSGTRGGHGAGAAEKSVPLQLNDLF